MGERPDGRVLAPIMPWHILPLMMRWRLQRFFRV